MAAGYSCSYVFAICSNKSSQKKTNAEGHPGHREEQKE